MSSILSWRGALLVALAISACGESSSEKDEPAGSSGDAGSSGNAGSVDAGAPAAGGTSGGIVLGGGSGTVTIPLEPPTWVDLTICGSISNDGTGESNTDCFYCCVTANYSNQGFFDGHCVCGNSPVGDEVCADQSPARRASTGGTRWATTVSPPMSILLPKKLARVSPQDASFTSTTTPGSKESRTARRLPSTAGLRSHYAGS
jgi:hypothetical protein